MLSPGESSLTLGAYLKPRAAAAQAGRRRGGGPLDLETDWSGRIGFRRRASALECTKVLRGVVQDVEHALLVHVANLWQGGRELDP